MGTYFRCFKRNGVLRRAQRHATERGRGKREKGKREKEKKREKVKRSCINCTYRVNFTITKAWFGLVDEHPPNVTY